jgi:hypothetical protein
MAVNIENELQSQLDTLNDKIAGLQELVAQRDRIQNTLGVLRGTLTVTAVKAPKAEAGKGTMSESHKLKIQLSNLKRRAATDPQNVELARKVKDVEALIASVTK